MATKIIPREKGPETRKRGGRTPMHEDGSVTIQTSFTRPIFMQMETLRRKKGISVQDLIRLLVANGLE